MVNVTVRIIREVRGDSMTPDIAKQLHEIAFSIGGLGTAIIISALIRAYFNE